MWGVSANHLSDVVASRRSRFHRRFLFELRVVTAPLRDHDRLPGRRPPLYLGYHWLTDTLASVALAVAILGAVITVDTWRTTRAAPTTTTAEVR